jgi:hypothetical protein
MPSAPSHLRSVQPAEAVPTSVVAGETVSQRAPHAAAAHGMTWLQCCGGLFVFVAWMLLFGSGILVDTLPYRVAISPSGAAALTPQATAVDSVSTVRIDDLPSLIRAWVIVLFCFLPLNLAWLCVAASTLGAFGNLANLGDDGVASRSRDTSNPYTSAILRGFFVYLFMMSGLMLLDDAPFSDAGPGQYIRLAGFLSLFSFVVSYQPKLFGSLIVSAFQRIQVRGGDNASQAMANSEADTVRASVDVERGTVDVAVQKHAAQTVVDSERR